MSKHTPTPWRASWIRPDPKRGHTFDPTCSILAPNDPNPHYRGEWVRILDVPDPIGEQAEADVEFLVRAVNAHDALVSTLREARDMAYGLARAAAKDVSTDVRVIAAEMERRFDAAIKLAEGE